MIYSKSIQCQQQQTLTINPPITIWQTQGSNLSQRSPFSKRNLHYYQYYIHIEIGLMLHFQFLNSHKPTQDQTFSQEGSMLPISNSVRSTRGISISMSGRSKGQKSHSRENRKPIFTKNQTFNSSEGFKGVKALDRKQSNRTDTDHDHHFARKVSSPEPIIHGSEEEKESSQAKLYSNNLLNLMKQQLEISIASTQSRMNEEIRKNNQELLRLESKLKDSQLIVGVKEQEIMSLRQKLDKAIAQKANNILRQVSGSEGAEFNKNFEYITAKLRDIQTKIKLLTNESYSKDKNKETLIISRLQQKVDGLFKYLLEQTGGKIQSLHKAIQSKFHHQIEQLSGQTVALLRDQECVREGVGRYEQMNQRLNSIQAQFKSLIKNFDDHPSKELKYDSSDLKSLRSKVECALKSISAFELEKRQVNKYLQEIEIQHSNLIHQIKEQHSNLRKQEELISSRLSKSQNRRRSEQVTQNQNLQTNNTGMVSSKSISRVSFQDTSYSDQEESVIRAEGNDRPHLVLKRLIETIHESKNSTPLMCQIDQTGYLKYSRSGTYVFDMDGNLFQLSKSQIAQAINSKIIKLP